MAEVDIEAFGGWLRSLAGFESCLVTHVEPVTGGASNHTYRVALAHAPFRGVALRIQRERGIFEPYDVAREAEVVRLLGSTGIPVPEVIGVEQEAALLGAPFAVYEWVEAPHFGEAVGASFQAFVEAVVAIHNLDWQSGGFGVLGMPPSPQAALDAELDLIERRMASFGCADHAGLMSALHTLRAHIPTDGRLVLCQGDINVFNYLYRDGRVVAVVDWEQARISDPRVDVGQLLALQNLRGVPFLPADAMPFVAQYSEARGTAITGMAYFRARWLFELGVIHFGWKLFNDTEPWYRLDSLLALLDRALQEIG